MASPTPSQTHSGHVPAPIQSSNPVNSSFNPNSVITPQSSFHSPFNDVLHGVGHPDAFKRVQSESTSQTLKSAVASKQMALIDRLGNAMKKDRKDSLSSIHDEHDDDDSETDDLEKKYDGPRHERSISGSLSVSLSQSMSISVQTERTVDTQLYAAEMSLEGRLRGEFEMDVEGTYETLWRDFSISTRGFSNNSRGSSNPRSDDDDGAAAAAVRPVPQMTPSLSHRSFMAHDDLSASDREMSVTPEIHGNTKMASKKTTNVTPVLRPASSTPIVANTVKLDRTTSIKLKKPRALAENMSPIGGMNQPGRKDLDHGVITEPDEKEIPPNKSGGSGSDTNTEMSDSRSIRSNTASRGSRKRGRRRRKTGKTGGSKRKMSRSRSRGRKGAKKRAKSSEKAPESFSNLKRAMETDEDRETKTDGDDETGSRLPGRGSRRSRPNSGKRNRQTLEAGKEPVLSASVGPPTTKQANSKAIPRLEKSLSLQQRKIRPNRRPKESLAIDHERTASGLAKKMRRKKAAKRRALRQKQRENRRSRIKGSYRLGSILGKDANALKGGLSQSANKLPESAQEMIDELEGNHLDIIAIWVVTRESEERKRSKSRGPDPLTLNPNGAKSPVPANIVTSMPGRVAVVPRQGSLRTSPGVSSPFGKQTKTNPKTILDGAANHVRKLSRGPSGSISGDSKQLDWALKLHCGYKLVTIDYFDFKFGLHVTDIVRDEKYRSKESPDIDGHKKRSTMTKKMRQELNPTLSPNHPDGTDKDDEKYNAPRREMDKVVHAIHSQTASPSKKGHGSRSPFGSLIKSSEPRMSRAERRRMTGFQNEWRQHDLKTSEKFLYYLKLIENTTEFDLGSLTSENPNEWHATKQTFINEYAEWNILSCVIPSFLDKKYSRIISSEKSLQIPLVITKIIQKYVDIQNKKRKSKKSNRKSKWGSVLSDFTGVGGGPDKKENNDRSILARSDENGDPLESGIWDYPAMNMEGIQCSRKLSDICRFILNWWKKERVNITLNGKKSNGQRFIYDLYLYLVASHYPSKVRACASQLQNFSDYFECNSLWKKLNAN